MLIRICFYDAMRMLCCVASNAMMLIVNEYEGMWKGAVIVGWWTMMIMEQPVE
jgi:hypothetical protein